jgi:hypothetical protein
LEPTNPSFLSLKQFGYRPVLNSQARTTTTVGDVSLYDNIWLDQAFLENTTMLDAQDHGAVFAFDKIFFPNNDDMARLTMSDHRPVEIQFGNGLFSTFLMFTIKFYSSTHIS